MDDAAERFVDRIRACLDRTADIVVAHPEEFPGRAVDIDHLCLVMDPGDQEQAEEMARVANQAVRVNPQIRLILSVNVAEDDSRELDQIPAARVTLRILAMCLTRRAFWRLSALEQAMILVAVGKARRAGPAIEVEPDWAWLIRP